jgi:hypothetical protein
MATYPMGIFEWQKVELALKQELKAFLTAKTV